ncbi:MAG TPA: Asp-tRNA(Asn)/Glu-tRNA(Gln) amidotransferase subunit GatB [Coriobacteriia bacterium]
MAKDRLNDALEKWEAVIGLEIHTELTSLNTKMFCGCPVAFGGEPNTRTCPVCLGMPGSLPVPNEKAIEATILAGLALDCEIGRFSQFHRKNYFYPDMPKDYQISQYDAPFCVGGHLDVEVTGEGAAQRLDRAELGADADGAYGARIGITRIHLEEDTGKMIHVGGAEGRIAGATHSLVDFNRAGTGLMELVSEPDIRTPEEARRFAQKLRLILLALGISDCNMEEGSMRVDANVSLRRRGASELGAKAEVKNMNSFKALHDALVFEIARQADVLDGGGTVEQETRHWDAGAKRTSSLRSKEYAHDYRYFPEPDMVPFTFDDAYIERVRERLPEMPGARKERYMRDFGLPPHDASVLSADAELARYYEETVESAGGPALAKAVSNWVLGDLSAYLNADGLEPRDSDVTPRKLARLVQLVDDGTISGKQAKAVFAEMVATGEKPRQIIERLGMQQVSDSGAIEEVVDRVLAANPKEVEAYRGGKAGLIGFFVGAVMRETGGQANPGVVNDLLRAKLGS